MLEESWESLDDGVLNDAGFECVGEGEDGFREVFESHLFDKEIDIEVCIPSIDMIRKLHLRFKLIYLEVILFSHRSHLRK